MDENRYAEFTTLCANISEYFEVMWKSSDEFQRQERLEREKRAIMGFEEDMEYYKEKISEVISERNLGDTAFPEWYRNLTEAVFAELYGLAGLSPWVYDETEAYRNSSSAKLIGDRLFCLIDGKSVLQPQRIGRKRREQLKRAFLMATPRERLEKGFHEVYLRNGIRVTIYSGERTKAGQDIMVFRKYLIKELTFEKMVELGTIPEEAPELFRCMSAIGFNMIFAGPVRSGKTTFLQTWQKYENLELEGLAVSTDPETDWAQIMPDAPIMQLVADGKELDELTKSILRGDNDYVLLEEMRDASAFRFALDITSTGTMRSKATVHSSDPLNLPYRMASIIRGSYGGSLSGLILQVFRNFNYVLEFEQVEGNRATKKLKGIYEYCYDPETDTPSVHVICRYDQVGELWRWKAHFGKDKETIAAQYPEEVERIRSILADCEARNPLDGACVLYPEYYRNRKEGDE